MTTPNQPKKVLLVITKTHFGGAQRYVFELAVALRERGYEVAVAGGGSGNLIDKLKAVNIPTFNLEGVERDFNLFKEIKAVRSLYTVIKNYRPDIIHLNSSKMGGLGSLVARVLKVPQIVFTAHGWPFLEPRPLPWRTMAWLGSYLTGLLAKKVILVSRHDLRHTHMPGVKGKCVVIGTAVADFPTLERAEAREALFPKETITEHAHNIWVGTIGELNHNKNHTAAIDAVAEFNNSNQTKILLAIISDGELKPALEEQVELKGLTSYVHFLGHKEEARQYLKAFDMFLLPSHKEGLPYALLEAGQVGLPCIASWVGGIPEVITNLESGLLIDPNNHMTIVRAFEYFLDNGDKRVGFAEALRQQVETNFSSEQMVKKTISVYESQYQ